jgi:hypothetical protein
LVLTRNVEKLLRLEHTRLVLVDFAEVLIELLQLLLRDYQVRIMISYN